MRGRRTATPGRLAARITGALAGGLMAMAGTAFAGESAGSPAVVVELYTSQGCASCPPADALMAELSAEPGIVALALHVDYWDYIGWADRFAKPKFTERQKKYARAAGARTIYTPQFIVAGTDRIEGSRPDELLASIRAHAARPAPVAMTIERAAERLRIVASSPAPLIPPALVQLVRYRPHETVEILRGENAGRTIENHNIVTAWTVLAEWSGEDKLTLETAAEGPDRVVVIIQAPGPGSILAAAALR